MGRALYNVDGTEFWLPNSIVEDWKEGKKKLIDGLPNSVREKARELQNIEDWRIYVVEQRRGRCYYRKKVITIPLWAINKGIEYKTWYLSHELAHAYNGIRDNYQSNDNHGPNFMAVLKQICPEDVLHFELTYKPRNAIAAGISNRREA